LGIVRDTEVTFSNRSRWEEQHVERLHLLTANTPILKIYAHFQEKVYREGQ